MQMEAPMALCSALWQRGAADYASAKNVVVWHRRLASEVELEDSEEGLPLMTIMSHTSDLFEQDSDKGIGIGVDRFLSTNTLHL